MSEPDAAACSHALETLLHWIPPAQRSHARQFLLRELESIHLAAGVVPPTYIGLLRQADTLIDTCPET